MSKPKVTNYTIEFKKSSAKLAVESKDPVLQTAKELGVHVTHPTWVGKKILP